MYNNIIIKIMCTVTADGTHCTLIKVKCPQPAVHELISIVFYLLNNIFIDKKIMPFLNQNFRLKIFVLIFKTFAVSKRTKIDIEMLTKFRTA